MILSEHFDSGQPLETEPRITIYGDPLTETSAEVRGIEIAGGLVAVRPDYDVVPAARFKCVLLALVGQSNHEIAHNIDRSPLSVRNQLRSAADTLQIEHRSGLTKRLIELELLQIVAPSEPLDITPGQLKVLTKAAEGKTDSTIASEAGLSVWTVSNHIKHTATKNGWSSRSSLASIAQFSGQISYE